jgi:hypothetical protein
MPDRSDLADRDGRGRRLCVFCGSTPGHDPAYAEATRAVGKSLVAHGYGLVYGGGGIGLMGELASAVLDAGGEVVGVIPRHLYEAERAHRGVTDLRVVDTMHERKAAMADLSDGFVGLPGGIGTYEELFEALTWAQLGIHAKPVGLVDVGGFFTPLLAFLDQVVATGFLRPEHRAMLHVGPDLDALLRAFAAAPPPPPTKWAEGQ